jgi:hypothetical protein
MTVILSPDGRCASTFVSPGDDVSKLRRCEGKFNHDGMHGSTEHGSAAWGDGAAYDHHPGEPLTIRTSELIEGACRLARIVADQTKVIADHEATIARLTAELAEARLLQSPFPDQSRRMGERELDERKPRSVDEPIPDARIARIWANVNKLAKDVTQVTGNPEREETYIRFLPELRGITARQPESGAPMAFTLIDGTEFVWAAGNLPWSIKNSGLPVFHDVPGVTPVVRCPGIHQQVIRGT